MATTYYASRTKPLSMDAHTNVSWALLFVAVIVIPGLLTFAESFVKPDGSGQDCWPPAASSPWAFWLRHGS